MEPLRKDSIYLGMIRFLLNKWCKAERVIADLSWKILLLLYNLSANSPIFHKKITLSLSWFLLWPYHTKRVCCQELTLLILMRDTVELLLLGLLDFCQKDWVKVKGCIWEEVRHRFLIFFVINFLRLLKL